MKARQEKTKKSARKIQVKINYMPERFQGKKEWKELPGTEIDR